MPSGSSAGAEITTFFAPPARCLAASARLRNAPEHSKTTSAPEAPHGSAAGSFDEKNGIFTPSTTSSWSVTETRWSHQPWTESYLRR